MQKLPKNKKFLLLTAQNSIYGDVCAILKLREEVQIYD